MAKFKMDIAVSDDFHEISNASFADIIKLIAHLFCSPGVEKTCKACDVCIQVPQVLQALLKSPFLNPYFQGFSQTFLNLIENVIIATTLPFTYKNWSSNSMA